MGLGDVKMLAMNGAFLGLQPISVVLFLATLAGALFAVTLLAIQKRSFASKLPFGTFLAMAAYVASIVGERLAQWYVSLYIY